MIRNFLLIAYRNLLRNRFFTFINVFGLAIGITACMLIFYYLRFETSFDKHIPNSDRIYRLYSKSEFSSAYLPPAIAPLIKENFPEIESIVRIMPTYGIINFPDSDLPPLRLTYSDHLAYVDPGFADLFGLKILAGDGDLTQPKMMLISRKRAEQLFGNVEEAIGKNIRYKDQFDYITYEVRGVFEDAPANTHLSADWVISHHGLIPTRYGWDDFYGMGWGSFFNYLRLKEGTNAEEVEQKIYELQQQLAPENTTTRFAIQAIPDIHLNSQLTEEPSPQGSNTNVIVMLSLGGFILIIAWLNYINLATAQSLARSVEVGVRKTIGASRGQLMIQFLLEAAGINFIAAVFSILLIDIFKNRFAELFDLPHIEAFWTDPSLVIGFLSIFILGTLASGLYPAFVMSKFKPLTAIRGTRQEKGAGLSMRKVLVVFQFALSLILIVATFSIYRQIQYAQSQKLGMNIAQQMVIKGPSIVEDSSITQHRDLFIHELRKIPEIRAIATSSAMPGIGYNYGNGGVRRRLAPPDERHSCQIWYMDESFIPSFEMEIMAGRNFSKELDNVNPAVVINKEAALKLGFSSPEAAIGEQIEVEGTQTVVGVIDNYHHQSLHRNYDPTVILYRPKGIGYFTFKVSPMAWREIRSEVDAQYQALFPGNPFNFFFLDQTFDALYKRDLQFANICAIFTIIGIFIACLGLLGLTIYSTTQRTKEIGIRKVLGASITDIVLMFSKELLILIGIAFIIAIPFSWWLIELWLENFAFRIEITAGLFLIPGISVILVALITVGGQTLRTAKSNPVKALRYE